jgi:3',5'-cyclic AMP phosphodiesterase CpdA
MERTFRIAHISDLHMSVEHSPQNFRNAQRLLEHILRLNVDHVVVTGDITADAKPKEFDAARKLFKSFGLLDSKKLSIVIGNHDIFGGVHTAEDIFEFPKRCKSADYSRKLDLFRETFAESFEKVIPRSASKLFPFIKLLGDFVLVGINSVAPYSRLFNPFGSNGEIDDKQFAHLRKVLCSTLLKAKRKIVLIHHHFYKANTSSGSSTMRAIWNTIEARTMKLRGKKRLLSLFSEANVELVLHGHVHENIEYSRQGIRFVNMGASMLGTSNNSVWCNLVSLTRKGITTERKSTHDSQSATVQIPLNEFLEATQTPPRKPNTSIPNLQLQVL